MKTTQRFIAFKELRLIVYAVLLTSVQAMAATVILPNGNRIDGTGIRANRNGDVILTTAAGQQTFPKGAYSKAIADKPADFDRARSMASKGQYDEAIAILEKVAVEYRYLEWDVNSYVTIAKIYSTQGKHKDAVDVYDRVARQSPALKQDAQFQWAYRDALLEAGMYDKLKPTLEQAITSGSRADAAKAQVMRGDIKLAEGQVEAAVMDYLRTARLFENEAAHAESLFKAGKGLEQLRDPRAKDMYQKLVEKYPSSDYAKDARSKL